MTLLWVAVAIFIINLPFGYWRARLKRMTLPWFLSIHIPVPIVVALRYAAGLGFRFSTLAVCIPAFFLGQFVGMKLNRRGT